MRGDRRSTRGHRTATCQLLDPALPAGGGLQVPLAGLAEARVGGQCPLFIIKGWQVKLGRGGWDPGGRAQQAWEERFLALQEGAQLALWVSSAEAR